MTDPRRSATAQLAAALAALPDRRDVAFSVDVGRVAWIDETALEWVDDPPEAHGPSEAGGGRVVFAEPLPAPTHVEIVAADLLGLCRPTAAGLEVIAVDVDGAGGTGTAR